MNMGLFDKMFGKGATEEDTATKRFDDLKNKYSTALNVLDQQHVQLYNLHLQDDKLFLRGVAPSQDAINKVWEQIRLINPNVDDVTLELSVAQPQAQTAAANTGQTSQQGGQSYTVKSGDTLSKISKQYYGDANEYMRIFYANRDKLNDPNKIQVGQQLVIPSDTDA
jgi:LysM repeat protein